MSSDLFQENTPVIEPTKLKDEEEVLSALVEEFNQMFRRESLEQNLSLVSKMNSSLEIPITMIYRDKKIQSISTNLALIREALSRSTSVHYDKEREILKPLFKARKNKIYVNKMPENLKTEILNSIYNAPEYNERISDKLIESIRCYNIILKSEDAASSLYTKIKSKLNPVPNSSFDLIWEYEDLYSNLLQKAQDSFKSQSYNYPDPNFGMNPYGNYFYGMQQNFGMMPPNPFGFRGPNPYNNNYYNGYYNQMFIRKAQDDNEEYYDQGGRQNRRKENRFRKGPNNKKGEKNRNQISEEDFEDPSKFPPLGSSLGSQPFIPSKKTELEEEKIQTIPEVKLDTTKKAEDVKPVPKDLIRFKRSAMIDLFKKISTQVKPHESLKSFEAGLPVLNLTITPDLEAINPTPPKEVMSTPKVNAMTPKVNAMTPKVNPK